MKTRYLVLLSFLLIAVGVEVSHYFSEKREENKALNECLEEVSNKCSASIGYAIALEEENAKLNKKLRECRNEGR